MFGKSNRFISRYQAIKKAFSDTNGDSSRYHSSLSIKHLDTQKKNYVIDANHNEELDEYETYIINKNSHYYVVESFKEILQKLKKIQTWLVDI